MEQAGALAGVFMARVPVLALGKALQEAGFGPPKKPRRLRSSHTARGNS